MPCITAQIAQPVWEESNILPACAESKSCSSKRCLVTDLSDLSGGAKECCAWDLYIPMGQDISLADAVFPTIPSVYITMEDASQIDDALAKTNNRLFVSIYSRPRPTVNISSFLIWAMGVITVSWWTDSARHHDFMSW